jgi:hypothetical protein
MTLNVPALPVRAQSAVQHDCRPARIRIRNTQPSLNQTKVRKIWGESFAHLRTNGLAVPPRYQPPRQANPFTLQ